MRVVAVKVENDAEGKARSTVFFFLFFHTNRSPRPVNFCERFLNDFRQFDVRVCIEISCVRLLRRYHLLSCVSLPRICTPCVLDPSPQHVANVDVKFMRKTCHV